MKSFLLLKEKNLAVIENDKFKSKNRKYETWIMEVVKFFKEDGYAISKR